MANASTLLVVLRHAHAARGEENEPDFERALDDRGRREAAEAGRAMLALGCRPARIVCSGAARTRQTVAGLGPEFAGAETTFTDALYHGGTDAYLAAARSAGAEQPLLLVGHNPSVADVTAALAGDGEASALRRLADGVPPATFAVLAFEGPPTAIAPGAGFLRHLFTPTRG